MLTKRHIETHLETVARTLKRLVQENTSLANTVEEGFRRVGKWERDASRDLKLLKERLSGVDGAVSYHRGQIDGLTGRLARLEAHLARHPQHEYDLDEAMGNAQRHPEREGE